MDDDVDDNPAPAAEEQQYYDDGFVVPADALRDVPDVIRMRHNGGGTLVPRSGVNLPDNDAGELFILGTAHVSEKSATDVKRAVELCKPDVLLVELCRARAGLLLQRAEPEAADAPAPELGWADIKRTLAERQGLSGIFQLLLTHSA